MPTVKNTPTTAADTDDRSSTSSDVANIDIIDDDGEEGEDEEAEADSEDEEEEAEEDPVHTSIVWTGYGKRIPVIVFNADAVVTKNQEIKSIGEKYHLAFKIVKTECKLVRSILSSHGFHEVHPNSNDYNLMWTGSHLKPYVLRGMQEFQKINHFPRSYEITRKDRLYKNVQRMQQTKGFRHFDFVPQSFIIPGEFQDFCSAFLKDKGPWIVKPIASSRGRGIFLVNHPEQVPLDDTMVVCRYLSNPLVIDGFKFDVRLYVAVTSYDPLIIYLYEEGLTRFATVRYEKNNRSIRNQCMHLTNYSVNKKSHDYVKNDDADIEDYGNKWSLGAMLRYLRSLGKDTTALMMRIEDVLIKTLVSAELPIATACKMFMPFRGNCFELYGFDILIDDRLRPWVLEVNLSPSLNCDAPLDLKIKSNMMSDLFSLVGFTCQDPMVRKMQQQSRRNNDVLSRPATRAQRNRPASASSGRSSKSTPGGAVGNLTGEEIKIVRRAKEEYQRRGGWVRIFPSQDSWELYGSYLQHSTSHNVMLYQQLFPDRARSISLKPTTAGYSSGLARTRSVSTLATRTRNVHLHSATYPHLQVSAQAGNDEALSHAMQRTLQYERKLICLGQKRRRGKTKAIGSGAPNINGKFKGVLVQGVPDDSRDPGPKTQQAREPPKAKPEARPSDDQKSRAQSKSTSKQGEPPVSTKTEAAADTRKEDVKVDPEDNDPGREKAVRKQPNDAPQPRESRESSHGADSAKRRPETSQKRATPEYNVVRLLEKGKTMSKVQARFAFASYLMRVQQRLMSESSAQEQDDVEAANEQMDLVLRFLKRAAGNLQQPFKVVVPSRKLGLNDRRRILAKQLGDFVHIYSKETEQLRQRHLLEKKVMKRPPSFSQNDGLDEEKFNTFVYKAIESELEDVLTTYTKLNKSASIFLGSNSKSSTDSRTLSATVTSSQSDTCLAKRKEASEHAQGVHKVKHRSKHNSVYGARLLLSLVPGPQGDTEAPPGGSLMNRPASSSYATAVTIYSAKLGGASSSAATRSRPASASTQRHSALAYHKSRPISASTRPGSAAVKSLPPSGVRERPDGAECNPDQVEEENINAALHRLTVRQQQRQYAAARSSNILPADKETSVPEQPHGHYPLAPEMVSAVEQYGYPHPDIMDEEVVSVKSKATSLTESSWKSSRSANDTFNSFVADQYTDSELASAYNQVTGVQPRNATGYHPTSGSTQYRVVQKKSGAGAANGAGAEAGRDLLEQSKLKHHQMIAQVHAAQQQQLGRYEPEDHNARSAAGGFGSLGLSDLGGKSGVLPPRPPHKPAGDRKSTSQHRLARTSASEDSSAQFYSSLKYDSSVGASKPVTNGFSGL